MVTYYSIFSTFCQEQLWIEFILDFCRETLRQMASDPVILNKPFSGQLLSVWFLTEEDLSNHCLFFFFGGCVKQRLQKLLMYLTILNGKCLKSQTFVRDFEHILLC